MKLLNKKKKKTFRRNRSNDFNSHNINAFKILTWYINEKIIIFKQKVLGDEIVVKFVLALCSTYYCINIIKLINMTEKKSSQKIVQM